MKIASLVIFSFLFTAMVKVQIEKSPGPNYNLADSILQKLSYELNSLQNIRYELKRELNYSSENYHNEVTWKEYFEFQSTDTIIGFKYQIEDSTAKQIFNGTESFALDKKGKTIKINDKPDQKSFEGISAFYNSIITIKNVLPLIIADKTIAKAITDTNINGTSYYLVTLLLNKRRIDYLGKSFDAMTTKSNFIYKIIIDKQQYLPFEILQVNDLNDDFIKTGFKNINTNAAAPAELSWYYSTYAGEYKPDKQKEMLPLISVGSMAPDWTLPFYNRNESISLTQLKGNVILLDFWIKNCGPCIESVPLLNSLQEKFKDKSFEIWGINSYDGKKDISSFCIKHKTDYKILMNGKVIAEKYGVSGYPAIILIDKKGKVLYTGSFDKSKVEELIEKAL